MKFRRAILSAIPAAVLLLANVPAHAVVFVVSYTAAVQGNANFGQIQNAVNFVSNEFSSTFSDPVTLNFTIDQNSTGLGESLFSNAYRRVSYADIKNALTADSKSADDASAVAKLPGAEPAVPVPGQWVVPSAEAKALGLLPANNPGSDGIYTFNSTQAYTYDPNNRKVAGAFDFVAVTEHEFSELMGRTSQLTNPGFGQLVYDLSRFTAPGVRDFGPSGNGVYFSVDGGATNLKNYNSGPGGDVQDWDSSDPSDPYNAFNGPNQGHALNALDTRVLDVIGWDLAAAAVPEPETYALMLAGLGAVGFMARRRKA